MPMKRTTIVRCAAAAALSLVASLAMIGVEPASAAAKPSATKVKAPKSCGTYMYFSPKAKKCLDARDKGKK